MALRLKYEEVQHVGELTTPRALEEALDADDGD
jgi:hypothetical protein